MTTTYDPHHRMYVDEADVRDELTRAFDLCQGCRRCVDRCASFPTLFAMLDARDDREAGWLTPADQDRVVDECHQCKLCALDCPYTPELHELQLDVPRLMLRAMAMRRAQSITSIRSAVATRTFGRIDRIGRLAVRLRPLANRVVGAAPGSVVRRILGGLTGVTARRALLPFASTRFSVWFRARPTVRLVNRRGAVTVYPTCVVEYQATDIGRDLVAVYERNGIECGVSDAGCCGAPSLHAGDLRRFARHAERTTRTLAAEIRSGTDVVVAQPGCAYVLRHEYPDHVAPALRPDAELVAQHAYDASEYLMKLHAADDAVVDTDFTGTTFGRIAYHVPCRLRAQDLGLASRDLMRLTGASIEPIIGCAGVDGPWDLRGGHDDRSLALAAALGAAVERAGGDVVVGDCRLATRAIEAHTGRPSVHPLRILALAYGLADPD